MYKDFRCLNYNQNQLCRCVSNFGFRINRLHLESHFTNWKWEKNAFWSFFRLISTVFCFCSPLPYPTTQFLFGLNVSCTMHKSTSPSLKPQTANKCTKLCNFDLFYYSQQNRFWLFLRTRRLYGGNVQSSWKTTTKAIYAWSLIKYGLNF